MLTALRARGALAAPLARAMHLSPRELDHLRLSQVGQLAQRRLARGCRLNHPEAVALISSQMMEMIRDGAKPVSELMSIGQRLLGRRQVMPGVASLIHEVQVEATFPDGTKLLTVHHPIAADDGDLALALQGSFLPVPPLEAFGGGGGEAEAEGPAPGALTPAEGASDIELNAGRALIELGVTNTGDRPIQVGSHYHFAETNNALCFDRAAARGMRLNIASGTAVRFEPGQERTVELVDYAGERKVYGFQGLTQGAL